MQLAYFIALVSLVLNGVLAVPGLYNNPSTVGWPATTCTTTWSTICNPVSTSSSCPPTPTPTAPISIANPTNICQSGNPLCCAVSATNSDNGSGHSCNQMDNSTINCDSTVLCCNDNGSGIQICTNSITLLVPFDLRLS